MGRRDLYTGFHHYLDAYNPTSSNLEMNIKKHLKQLIPLSVRNNRQLQQIRKWLNFYLNQNQTFPAISSFERNKHTTALREKSLGSHH